MRLRAGDFFQRRRPRHELFGPLAKWPHIDRHRTETHRLLDDIREDQRAVLTVLEQIRDRLPQTVDRFGPAAMRALDDATWCADHNMLRGGCRPLHLPDGSPVWPGGRPENDPV